MEEGPKASHSCGENRVISKPTLNEGQQYMISSINRVSTNHQVVVRKSQGGNNGHLQREWIKK